jgi:hypothetical protein
VHISRIGSAIVLAGVLLAACSTLPAHQPLSEETRAHIGSTDVVLPIHESEIYVFVPHSTAGASGGAAGGMIGALVGAMVDAGIDAERTKKAETAVTPLRNAMVDYNFDSSLQAALKTSLTQTAWLHAADFGVIRDVTDKNLGASMAASHADAVLFIAADYRLANDGDVMLVTLAVRLVPNSDQLRALRTGKHDDNHPFAQANALYRNTMTFEARVTGAKDRDGYIGLWSADKGKAARAALDMAIQKLAPLLAQDIQRTGSDVAPPADAPQVATSLTPEISTCMGSASEAQCGTNATVVETDADGQFLRFKDGSLRYVKTAAQ